MEISYIASCVFYLFTPNKFQAKKNWVETRRLQRDDERERENGRESYQNVGETPLPINSVHAVRITFPYVELHNFWAPTETVDVAVPVNCA